MLEMIHAFHLFCCKKNMFGSDNENCFPIIEKRKMNMTLENMFGSIFFKKHCMKLG